MEDQVQTQDTQANPTTSDSTDTPIQSPFDQVSPEYQGLIETKGWKTPDDVLRSYSNLESYVGKSKNNAIVLPDDPADTESWSKVWSRLGKPDTPNGYTFNGVDLNDPVEKEGYEDFTNFLHSQNVPKQVGEKFFDYLIDLSNREEENSTAQLYQFATQNEQALKQELGQAYKDQIYLIEQAGKSVGLTPEHFEQLKSAEIYVPLMKALAKVGEGLQEGGYISGERTNSVTPAGAKTELETLKADPDYIDASTNPQRHKVLRAKAKALYEAMYAE